MIAGQKPASDQIDLVLTALADAGRRRMIEQLSQGPASVSVLARPLGIGLPSAVKHLAVLEAGGLVHSVKAGRVRTFSLAPSGFHALEAWVAQRKQAWTSAFDRLDAYLEGTAEQEGNRE